MLSMMIAILVHCFLYSQNSVLISKPGLKKKTNKYKSHDIQNECLKIMSSYILRKLSKDIHDGGWFTIMSDKCTDVANKEQFTFCIRWINQ